jgi:uncharacterized protein YqhQ
MKLSFKKLGIGAIALSASASAMAESVLTTEMKTALEDGFTNLQDTVGDVIGTAWPFVLAIAVILIAPSIVSRLISRAAGR